jgi:hypothetical protein
MFQRMNHNTAPMAGMSGPRAQAALGRFDKARTALQAAAAAALAGVLVSTTGALNGGTLPPASVFTPLKTWLQTNFLGSDWVLLVGLVCLVVLVWSLMHGKGWANASIILGVLSVALLGPGLLVALATATREPAPIVQQVNPAVQKPVGVVGGSAASKTLLLGMSRGPVQARV